LFAYPQARRFFIGLDVVFAQSPANEKSGDPSLGKRSCASWWLSHDKTPANGDGRKKRGPVLQNGFPCHLMIVSLSNFTTL
jgi:hypothetical protein